METELCIRPPFFSIYSKYAPTRHFFAFEFCTLIYFCNVILIVLLFVTHCKLAYYNSNKHFVLQPLLQIVLKPELLPVLFISIIQLRVGYDGGLAREIVTQIDTHIRK